jgi:hypothetical protein
MTPGGDDDGMVTLPAANVCSEYRRQYWWALSASNRDDRMAAARKDRDRTMEFVR